MCYLIKRAQFQPIHPIQNEFQEAVILNIYLTWSDSQKKSLESKIKKQHYIRSIFTNQI
jgi:hypothetical protein